MDRVAKLLARVPKKHKEQLLEVINCLKDPACRGTLRAEKLSGSSQFRIRTGWYRLFFHIDKDNLTILDSVRLRNEKTYRDM
jgi:mRNA-degrading endonuclease RelE of RelBE toxin-antitoxin system